MIDKLNKLSLKNKIFLSTLVVILLLSVGIALVARWVLVSSLMSRLQHRGMGIAQSIADRGRGHILTRDIPELTSLLFDAVQLGEREVLVSYIFVLDKKDRLLAHTFITPFPEKLLQANTVPPGEPYTIKLFERKGKAAYDIAVPVKEGIYRIGAVHVGLNKTHIDSLIGKLRITFLGFIGAIALIFFWVSHWLARYITRPMPQLISMANEISRGNLDIKLKVDTEVRCWDLRTCDDKACPAYKKTELPCWYVDETGCRESPDCKKFPEKLDYCYDCVVYKHHVGDEITQLAHSFNHMARSLKASRTKLRESEEKYRSLSDSGPNPIFVVARETRKILDANPSAADVYGYERNELIGKNFKDLGPFEYEETTKTTHGAVGGPVGYAARHKTRHFKKGRRPFYVNVHASPTRYEDQEAIIIATTDITEMIEKDAQLIQAAKMTSLGEMSAGIAHELNQPLNAIKMGTEYLDMMIDEKKKIPDESIAGVMEEISGQVDRAAEIIERLKAFGRKADFTKERIDVNGPVREVEAIVRQQLALMKIKVVLELDETLPPILAHSNRLEQVFFNLVANARDAISQKRETGGEDAPGIITLRSFLDEKRVVVAVSDTGIGIPKEARDKIFEPFYTTKEVGKGMGLGLSIIYGIVRDYGGEISVEDREDPGTTFRVSFPQVGQS